MTFATSGEARGASRLITVLHVNQALSNGGSLVLMTTLAKYLVRRNVRVVMALALQREKLNEVLEQCTYHHCKPLITYQHQMNLARLLERWPRWLRAFVFAAFELARLVSTFKFAIDIRHLVKRERIDLVHIHHCTITALACALQGFPFIYHLHGELGTEVRGVVRWALRRATHVIAISSFIQQSVLAKGIDPHQVVLLYNPLTLHLVPDPGARIKLLTRWEIPMDRIVIAHIGRIAPWKGQLEFLLALARMDTTKHNLHALIVGSADKDPTQEEYLRELIATVEDHHLTGRVTFTGYQKDAASIYAGCDVVAHTSVAPEPFGLVITEAMAAGKAVIASSLGAGAEIVQDGITGMIVDPRDPQDIADKLRVLAMDSTLRARLGEAARRNVVDRFDPEQYAEKVAVLYANPHRSPFHNQHSTGEANRSE